MILLDTCALLWLNEDRSRFTDKALKALESEADELAVSAISMFEIGVKVKRGKLKLPMAPVEWLERLAKHYGLLDLSLSSNIAGAAAELPEIHRDPFDRLIIATAIDRRVPIVTADKIFSKYPGVRVIW